MIDNTADAEGESRVNFPGWLTGDRARGEIFARPKFKLFLGIYARTKEKTDEITPNPWNGAETPDESGRAGRCTRKADLSAMGAFELGGKERL